MTVTMNKFHTSPSRHYNGPQDYPNGGVDQGDVSFISGSPSHGYVGDNQTGTVFIRISIPELKIQKCLQFELDETVWQAKQRLLSNFPQDLRDAINYGLYMPPMNGRAGKFLDEERFLSEYPLQGPIGFLEFKHKKRVYKLLHVNPRKLKQLHTKSNLKVFMEYVRNGNIEKVTKMTNKGLDPNIHEHSTGETPLTIACTIKGGRCKEMVLALVGGGAHLDFRNKKGMTAMHKAVLVKNALAVKVMLDLGMSPNMKDARVLTPLYYGVAHDTDPIITEMLLQERAFIGCKDEQDWFEIHHACKQGLLQHLEHLLFYGADMDVQNSGGNTALHICALNNQESCLRVLLFRGANKDIENYQNQTAYQVAIISGNQEIAHILQEHKSEEIVQYREIPKYSMRRRDSVASAAMFALSRSRSDPRINLIMSDNGHNRFISPSSSTQSFSHLDNISSPSRDYSDSPRSMSISSTSSGPGLYEHHYQFSEDPSPYQEHHQLWVPGFNGSVRSLTHINSVFNRQKIFPSHSTYAIPDRPRTLSSAMSARLGLNHSRRRFSEVYNRDRWQGYHGNEILRQSWCDVSSDVEPYSTSNVVPNRSMKLPCSNSGSTHSLSNDLKEYEIEWKKPENFNNWDDKIKQIEMVLDKSRSYKERNVDQPLNQNHADEFEEYWKQAPSKTPEKSKDIIEDSWKQRATSKTPEKSKDIIEDSWKQRATSKTPEKSKDIIEDSWKQRATSKTPGKSKGLSKFKPFASWSKSKTPSSLSQIDEENHYMRIGKNDDSIYICTKTYEAENPGELSMKKGEIVEVIGTKDDGFWEGRINGHEGYFHPSHIQEVRLRKAGSCGDILRESTLQRNTLASIVHTYSDYAPRTVVLQKGPEGYGFILRGAKSQSTRNGELDFHPTPEFPALQYLDSVDPGSRADRAGLKGGDFILEINGENVVRASHDRVVQIIRHSGDTLAMKVVTVQKQQTPVNWQHLDGTMTLPTRGTSAISKKQAPQPPRRDPRTSLSKEKGRQIAEGLNELDQLDLALAEFERETNEQPNISTEQKTASIRAKHASKRVSCVDLSNIESHDSDKSEHRGPSERLVHKYSNDRKLSAMDRSQSTPDLSDKKPEPVYATPVVPGSVGAHRKNSSGNVYATPEDNVSMKSGMSTMERPKAPPPPPPGASGGKRPAPGLPMDNDTTLTSKAEVVSINTTGSRTSLYARPEKSSQNDDYESSFRPGASAKMTDEPKIKLKTHQRTSSHASTNSGGSRQSDDKHSVSFAEDKVLDNAKTYLQKHPNAKLLVTADVHSNDKKQATSYEPEPDYDMEEDKNKSKVTVISIGDRKMGETESKRFSVRSDIPSGNIPPPPSEPAPQPPSMKSKAPSPVKSSAPQPMKATAPQSVMAKSSAPKPPSPKSKTPSPKIEHKKQESPKREEPKVGEPAVPAPPAPPPPPVPPLPPSDGPPPLPKTEPPAMTKTEVKAKTENKTPQGVQASDLLAAVQKRQQRMDEDGPKISALPPAKDGAPKDDNQAAIIAAVARRRKMLEEKGEKSIIDSIESRLQKTKKLQSAKLAFSSDNIGNTPEAKRKSATLPDTRVNGKTETKSPTVKTPPKVEAKPISEKPPTKVEVKSSLPPKVEIKPIKTIPIKGKEPTKIMSTVNGTVEKPDIRATEKKVEPILKEEDSKTKTEIKDNAQLSPRSTNYVAMAEKARLAYLQKKASQSSLNVSATNNTGKTKPGEKAKIGPTSPVKTGTNSKAPVRDQNKNIISTGTEGKQVFNSDSQIPNGNVKNSNNGDVKSFKQTNNGDNSISIRDRIASINKIEQKKVNSNGKLTNDKISVKGVTVNSSITDKSEKSSVPPPPEFGDSVQVEIIPPPSGFDSGSNFSDISRHSSVLNHEDNESVVSSVSTLSTLSDDQADSGYGRQRHNYEELIAPPPPEFGDSSNQEYETIPSVIPPPPDFGENNSKQISKPFNSKSLDSWQCLDVLDWLDSLKLSQYKTGFQQKCIDGKRLQNLSRNDYIDLGVTQVGHRMNLERSIKKLTLPKNIVSSSHL